MPRLLALAAVLVAVVPAIAQEKKGRKVALLVAVQDYTGTGMSNLKYCENDITELAKVLKAQGYKDDDVTVLTQTAGFEKKQRNLFPKADNVRAWLKSTVEDLRPEDTVLVAFSGHGAHLKELKEKGMHFCPLEADLEKPNTLVSLTEVYEQLDKTCKAGVKVLLVDACRNDPTDGKSGGDGRLASVTRPLVPDPPGGLVAFFSCSTGEKSYESDALKHGIFFHHVITGLKGGPTDKPIANDGEVTVPLLEDYLMKAVPVAVKKDKNDPTARQVPERKGSLRGAVALANVVGVAPTPRAAIPTPTAGVTTGVQAKPVWAAAHDLKVRKGRKASWDTAQKVGVEVFNDPTHKAVMAITAAGNIAVASDGTPGEKADYVTGLDLSFRVSGEEMFTDDVPLFGVEVYKGVLPNHLLYLSKRGGLAFHKAAGVSKDSQFQYGLSLKVRKPGEDSFDGAKAFGVEAYKDSTGGLVYVTEAGMLATAAKAPDKAPEQNEIKRPKPLYGLEAKGRKAEEADFTDKTRTFGVEVYRDENTGTLIYISQNGSIAALPPPAKLNTGQRLVWASAMTLKARPAGESDFDKAVKIGVEVYRDEHTGYMLYITETGSIAVLPK